MEIIAHIRSDFSEKFGIPRQSGLVGTTGARIVFEPKYRHPDAIRGIGGFSHIWLLWLFSENQHTDGRLTVRPPRLGGNERMGVFATRSSFRPNGIGLSSVKLESVDFDSPDSPALIVSGADLLDGTPIIDIKPYLPFTDSHPDAKFGFAGDALSHMLTVTFENGCADILPEEIKIAVRDLLSLDPRPSYQNDEERIYGMKYAGYEIRFRVSGNALTVIEASKIKI